MRRRGLHDCWRTGEALGAAVTAPCSAQYRTRPRPSYTVSCLLQGNTLVPASLRACEPASLRAWKLDHRRLYISTYSPLPHAEPAAARRPSPPPQPVGSLV